MASRQWPGWVKRTLDVLVATGLLLSLLPVLLVVALLVWASSPGPVLFRQARVGKDGRCFTLYKFRTMVHGSDPSIHRAYYRSLIVGEACPNGDTFKLRDDPRTTPVGRVLRRLSLDEVPQLLNVLQGTMSLVGPRPALPYEVELYGPRERRRLTVSPGLTGLWQTSGRARLTFQQMIDLDLSYIDGWSIWLDVRILARTPWAVLVGDGAC
jgi:lipopolysaccharide/colanic/teichoic acid biosynthesis glycosyltransferase